jgi:hypothetical protein
MKQTFFPIAAALAALTLIFSSCSNPVTDTDTLTTIEKTSIPEIDGPAWVKAVAYPGVITVSWAFARDAVGYEVYRQRADGRDGLLSMTVPASGQQMVSDIVSPSNQLEDGAEYLYYVRAVSSLSDTNSSFIIATETVLPQLVRDGVNKASVRANVPARYKDDAWQDVRALLGSGQSIDADSDGKDNEGWIAAEKVVTSSGNAEKLLLTWPHYNPGYKYTIHYDIGTAVTLHSDVSSPDLSPNDASSPALGVYAFYAAPLFGGLNTAKIAITLNGDEYYYRAYEVTKTLPAYTLDVLAAPSSVTVTRSSATGATVSWTAVDGAPNPGDYKVWRIKAPTLAPGNTYTADGSQITVEGDWTQASGTVSVNGSAITLYDSTGIVPGSGYLYAVYAETGSRKSPAAFGSMGALAVPAVVPALNLAASYEEDAATERRVYSVVIGWNRDENHASYKLERAPVSSTSTSGQTVLGAWTEISVPAPAAGRYTVVDKPALWKSYRYRLTVANSDNVAVYAELDLNTHPFLDSVDSSLTVASSTATAYSTTITIGAPNYKTDLFVDIYRASVPENSQVATLPSNGAATNLSVEEAAFARIATNIHLKTDTTWSDENLLIGTQYLYRHVVKASSDGTAASAVEIRNTDTALAGATGYVQQPSVPSLASITDAGSSGGSSPVYYFKAGTATLPGAKVELQRRAASPGTGDWTVAITGTVKTVGAALPAGSTLAQGDRYIQFAEPDAADKSNYQYRLVLVKEKGTLADNTDTATPVSGSSVIATW